MTRRPILARLGAAALTSAALLALAGCGQATDATAADDPAPTSGAVGGGDTGSPGDTATSDGSSDGSSDGQAADDLSQPQWPSLGCDSRSVVSVDYGRMPTGYRTPQEAVERSPAVDLPAGVLTLAPTESAPSDFAKGPAQVWVVDPETNEIQAQVSVFRGPDGWFVDGVMTCS